MRSTNIIPALLAIVLVAIPVARGAVQVKVYKNDVGFGGNCVGEVDTVTFNDDGNCYPFPDAIGSESYVVRANDLTGRLEITILDGCSCAFVSSDFCAQRIYHEDCIIDVLNPGNCRPIYSTIGYLFPGGDSLAMDADSCVCYATEDCGPTGTRASSGGLR